MEETKDEIFIAGMLGKGICVIPDGDTVYAPDDGVIIALMGHAVGIKLDNGVELIVLVTNSFEYSDVTTAPLGDVAVGDKVLKAIK